MSKLGARAIAVKQVRVSDLSANPHNPRLLFDKVPLATLRESIRHAGILVPLTVYRDSKTKGYVILDGQRRWMCAKDLGHTTVPVNEVEEPDLVQNIVTMFQIHKLREDWELMPTALKLQVLMDETGDANVKHLAVMTGLDESVVGRCKKLLSYEKKYHEMMLNADPEQRTKADFFIELYPVRHDRFVKKFDWFKPVRFTDQMLVKWEAKTLKAVTDFRVVKQHITNAAKANRVQAISKRLKAFAEVPSATVDTLQVTEAESFKTAREITKAATKLYNQLEELDVERTYGEKAMWDSLEALSRRIQNLLRRADRRIRS